MKKKMAVSFSGGRTSAYMTWWLFNKWGDRDQYEIVVVFANTGKEDSGTLVFVHKFSRVFNIPIVWVEARHKDSNGEPFSKKGWAVRHEVVDYFTASREGEPFEEMISVLGIPSTNSPFCSSQLKKAAIESYIRSIGWENYEKAIGIRADEIDRMNPNFRKENILYPLIRLNPVNKKMVGDFWSIQTFDLRIDPDFGNCDACWKKDMKRLVRVAGKQPERFQWWQSMTDKYGGFMPREMEKLKPPYNFYRGNLSPKNIFDLLKLSNRQLKLFVQDEKLNSCSETCEAF